MKSEKQKTVYKGEKSIEVNNDTATMIYQVAHNEKTGNLKITATMTTRHISFNEDIETAVLRQWSELGLEAYEDAKGIRRKWIEEQNKIPGTATIPFPGMDDGEEPKSPEEKADAAISEAMNDQARKEKADAAIAAITEDPKKGEQAVDDESEPKSPNRRTRRTATKLSVK